MEIYLLGHCLLLLCPLVRALLEHCSYPLFLALGTVGFGVRLDPIGVLDLLVGFWYGGFGFVGAFGILRHFPRHISCGSSSTSLGCWKPSRYDRC